MKAKVTEQGVLIPRQLLEGVKEVEIRQNAIIVVPVANEDPIPDLGQQPFVSDVDDASANHDRHLYGPKIRTL